MWEDYILGKQTYKQLSVKYELSIKTIQRRLDKVKISIDKVAPTSVVVLMDTTYFGRGFGVMVFRDGYTSRNLYKLYVKSETNLLYSQGIDYLLSKDFKIVAIVCDGRRGLLKMYPNIPTQMCQFHQVAIIKRYLTRKPKMLASKELWEITLLLKQSDKENFIALLNNWHTNWETFLNERRVDEKGKKRYVHKKLRSAYRSLKTNLPFLFTWYDNKELNIPNTTNAIDGHFSDLKNKLRSHNGLSLERKKKFIDEFLKA